MYNKYRDIAESTRRQLIDIKGKELIISDTTHAVKHTKEQVIYQMKPSVKVQ